MSAAKTRRMFDEVTGMVDKARCEATHLVTGGLSSMFGNSGLMVLKNCRCLKMPPFTYLVV